MIIVVLELKACFNTSLQIRKTASLQSYLQAQLNTKLQTIRQEQKPNKRHRIANTAYELPKAIAFTALKSSLWEGERSSL